MAVRCKYGSMNAQWNRFIMCQESIRTSLRGGATVYEVEDQYKIDIRLLKEFVNEKFGPKFLKHKALYRKPIYEKVGNLLREGYRTDTIARILPISQYELSTALDYESKNSPSRGDNERKRVYFDTELYEDKKKGDEWRFTHDIEEWPDYYFQGMMIGKDVLNAKKRGYDRIKSYRE